MTHQPHLTSHTVTNLTPDGGARPQPEPHAEISHAQNKMHTQRPSDHPHNPDPNPQDSDLDPVPTASRMCPTPTIRGFRCGRVPDHSGYCPAHKHNQPGAPLIDPLEVMDWAGRVECLRIMQGPRQPAERARPADRTTSKAADMSEPAEQSVRHLQAVPDPAAPDEGGGWTYEEPDVVGPDTHRRRYRLAMPGLDEDTIDAFADLRAHHLKPPTVKSYHSILRRYYRYAADNGFHPLDCDGAHIEAYVMRLMLDGKPDGGGRYSRDYFTMFTAALRRAAHVKSLPDPTADSEMPDINRAYLNEYASELPREAKDPVLVEDLIEIVRHCQEGSTPEAARLTAIIAVGCHPELGFSTKELAALTLAHIAVTPHKAEIICPGRANAKISLEALEDDSACPVAALDKLKQATHARLQAAAGGVPPTDEQVRGESLFVNQRTGAPLTANGLKGAAIGACAMIADLPDAERGKLPALTLEQRRAAITSHDHKMIRDVALVLHTAFSAARSGEIHNFNIGDIRLGGNNSDDPSDLRFEFMVPLVTETGPDGTVTVGMIDRVKEVRDNDLLDSSGQSIYKVIVGMRNVFARGTKTKDRHENWIPAQPGHPACPVLNLIRWLKLYDRLVQQHLGRRLRPDDPLFCNLRNPPAPISSMSRTVSATLRQMMAAIGCDTSKYSAHSLRKFRSTAVLDQGGSMTDVLVHDGRSSEPAGLPYAHRNTRRPLRSDPMVGVLDKASPTPSSAMTESKAKEENAAATEPQPPDETAGGGLADTVEALRGLVEELRHAGFDDAAIVGIAGLRHG